MDRTQELIRQAKEGDRPVWYGVLPGVFRVEA